MSVTGDGFHHVGNSTHLIVLDGVRVLTDPWISEPAEYVLGHRVAPAPLPRDPDVVLITHLHDDHFDLDALDRLDRAATVVCPDLRGTVARVRDLGFADVRGVHDGDVLRGLRGPLDVEVVRGRHNVPEVCYRLTSGTRAVFFGGDTMRTPEIDDLARRKPTAFVVLPGERSSLLGKRYVMTPDEAIDLAKLFGADVAVLTHHETRVLKKWPIGWMIRIDPPQPAEFPSWFRIPSPGQFIEFPWEAAS
jgi:L-ascorbate metabolism protein UlaG (beta-lactamase superfamily)